LNQHVKWHLLFVLAIWAVLTLVGYLIVMLIDPFPVAASEEAVVVDEAFTLLTLMSVPVFTFVVSVLLYSAFRFRIRSAAPSGDGPSIRYVAPVVIGWFVITSALTGVMIVHPGITGLNEIRHMAEEPVDMVIELEGRRFFWNVHYTQQGVTSFTELVLPIDAHVHFRITSHDVLHSFWIPAFRVKIDAVPGSWTTINATPNEFGTFEEDANFRVQCAELCGAGHASMAIPVRVVSQQEFDEWIGEQTTVGLAR
jgi:cytochrome c oxidase subunit II